jgi:hypothetical protein
MDTNGSHCGHYLLRRRLTSAQLLILPTEALREYCRDRSPTQETSGNKAVDARGSRAKRVGQPTHLAYTGRGRLQ